MVESKSLQDPRIPAAHDVAKPHAEEADSADLARQKNAQKKPRTRVWTQEVAVGVTALRAELAAIRARAPRASEAPDKEELGAICKGISTLLDRARDAAEGRDPRHQIFRSWWHGNGVEAAFQNLHRAEADIARAYDDQEVDAVVPEAVARACGGLSRDDLRRAPIVQLPCMPPGHGKRLMLRKAIQIGHEAKDQHFTKIRKFRNIVILTSALIFAFVLLFAVVVSINPDAVPFCFTEDRGTPSQLRHCATHESRTDSLDVWIVGLLGLLGGSLAAAVAIRKIRGTPSPYNLPIALAFLKVPAGALTAIGALIALSGQFIPGFSALDSPEQILAYALIFGYAQQLFTGLIERRALALSSSVPNKTRSSSIEDDKPDPPLQMVGPGSA